MHTHIDMRNRKSQGWQEKVGAEKAREGHFKRWGLSSKTGQVLDLVKNVFFCNYCRKPVLGSAKGGSPLLCSHRDYCVSVERDA